ncbi:MAG TPA: protein kinase [Ktedonobacteraceae bacterium]|jgi:serine/threonine protein kinase|nr:protein kinase [Ktedonobacteraceae bacterium]
MFKTLVIGTQLRKQYRVEKLLGQTSDSAVYLVSGEVLVENPDGKQHLATRFALKEFSVPDRYVRHQVNFEIMHLRSVDHPHLPHVYDIFNINKYNRLYILMDYVEGQSLEQLRLQQFHKRFSPVQVREILEPVMDAVTYLHSLQPPLFHQQIRAENILLVGEEKNPVLVNFGVCRQYLLKESDSNTRRQLFGYDAPELYRGETGIGTDIYELGATCYALLTGFVPAHAMLRKSQLERTGVDPLKAANRFVSDIPASVAGAIQRALSLNPDQRFATVEAFKEALQDTRYGKQEPTRPLFITREAELVEPVPVTTMRKDEQDVTTESLMIPPTPQHIPRTLSLFPLTELPRKLARRKIPVVAFLLIVLLALVGTSSGLLLALGMRHAGNASSLTATIEHSGATPTRTSIMTPPVTLAGTYKGKMFDLAMNSTDAMSLIDLQQYGTRFTGRFVGMYVQGPFEGNINVARQISFTVKDANGHAVLSFSGAIQTDGNIAGTYCSLTKQERCSGAYGIWSAAPASP